MLALALSGGCGPSVPPLDVDDTRGNTLDVVDAHLGQESTLIVQDLSVLVDAEPTYGSVASSPEEWLIVAACADTDVIDTATDVEVGVIPDRLATPSIHEKIRANEYLEAIGSCASFQ
ncbi:hypothetical protein [Cellulosimicrobium cellulans]|uniref:hypothetical protein n=1 Tax=Cellulosimicrobium cellulans TaxID=1710 RepID=UPI001BA90546|nr:hypothetical protein [Cellulosimicrobium cellulans]QUB99057.1 hypothetical protein J5A69_15210 [Cellulosimicrobium cellulans]